MRTMPLLTAATLLAAAAGDVHAEEDAGPKDKDKAKDPLSIDGRVFSRFTAASIEGEAWEGEIELASARLTVNYQWKETLRTKIAIEAAGGPEVKDAFLDLALGGGVTLRAGNFKLPLSVIEDESALNLPTIGRGMLADALEDGMTITGRRAGVQATWEAAAGGPRVMAIASQSVATDGTDPARALSDGGGVAATVRAEHDVGPGVRLGVVGSNRETIDGASARRYWAGGADAEVDLEEQGLGLRLWADVLVGTSHLGAAAAGRDRTTFIAAQALTSWRFGGEKKNRPYVEPFVLASFLNPSVDRARDDVTELAAGVGGGRWKRWRGQGQVSLVNARAFRPSGLGGPASDVNDAVTITFQLTASF